MRLVDNILRLIRYVVSGLDLLRSHPSLLIIPLLLALTNGLDLTAYEAWRTYRHHGDRDTYAIQHPLVKPDDFFLLGLGAEKLRSPIEGIWLWSTCETLKLSLLDDGNGDKRQRPILHRRLVLTPFCSFISLVITSLILSGYYGAAAVADGLTLMHSSVFWHSARRNWGKFFVYAVGVWVFLGAGSADVGSLALVIRDYNPRIGHAIWRIHEWSYHTWAELVKLGISLLLSLTLWGIAVDNKGLLWSIGDSAKTILRDLPMSLALFATTIVMVSLAQLPYAVLMRADIFDRYPIGSFPNWLFIPVYSMRLCIFAVLGTWINLILLVWYRDATITSEDCSIKTRQGNVTMGLS